MSRFAPQILTIIMLSLVFIHGIHVNATIQRADSSSRGGQESTAQLNQDTATLFDQQGSSSARFGEGPDSADQQLRPPTSAAINHDDYHSNIDLDKINEAYRYEMLDGDGGANGGTSGSYYAINGDTTNYNQPMAGPMQGTLIGRMLAANNKNKNNNNNNIRYPATFGTTFGSPAGQLAQTFLKTKRFPRYGLSFNPAKEDKDYTFVGLAATNPSGGSRMATMNQDLASRVSLLASDVLRDLSLANQAKNRLRTLDQLSSAYLRSSDVEPSLGANDIVANSNREKRRRCKVDPNLGVKNPSFCDTDAYFGAAAYNMRDVWDSAGR